MASRNNGAHDNVANNDDICVAPRGCIAASESGNSTSLADTSYQSIIESLAEDFNITPLPPMPVTT